MTDLSDSRIGDHWFFFLFFILDCADNGVSDFFHRRTTVLVVFGRILVTNYDRS